MKAIILTGVLSFASFCLLLEYCWPEMCLQKLHVGLN